MPGGGDRGGGADTLDDKTSECADQDDRRRAEERSPEHTQRAPVGEWCRDSPSRQQPGDQAGDHAWRQREEDGAACGRHEPALALASFYIWPLVPTRILRLDAEEHTGDLDRTERFEGRIRRSRS